MILAIDVGNTTTDVAMFAGDDIDARWRRATCELAPAGRIDGWLQSMGIDWSRVEGAAFCTVVQSVRRQWQEALAARVSAVLEATSETPTALRNEYSDPARLGADRYCAALSALARYGGPVIAVSVGTAITVDAVSAEGAFLGGAIAPGIAAARSSLAAACEQLPEIDLDKPPHALGRDTDAALRAGLVFGAVGAIKELVARIAELAAIEPRVVLAGGDAELVAPYLDDTVAVDTALVLHGLRIAWEQTTGAKSS